MNIVNQPRECYNIFAKISRLVEANIMHIEHIVRFYLWQAPLFPAISWIGKVVNGK